MRNVWARILAAAGLAPVLLGTGCFIDLESAGGQPPVMPEPVAVDGMPGTVAADPAGSASPSGATCRGYYFPVTQQEDSGAVHRVFGQLCAREQLTSDTPIQVLLHGGTYDHAYWDWPYQPETYSYVDHATRRGFATLNVDRLGYGKSDRPDPRALGFPAAGHVTRQLVQYLRRGALGLRFESVVLNGHSMGGIAAEHAAAEGAAAEGAGVDAVIISGIAPDRPETDPAPEGPPDPGADEDPGADPFYPFYPAEEDPKFAGESWSAGYLTTRPNTRAAIFLHEGTYDPAIAALEESLKDTLTVAELSAVRSGPGSSASVPDVEAPVTYVLGRHDAIACGAAGGDCAAASAAQDAGYIVPDSGHSINVSDGAPLFYEWTFAWLAERGISRRSIEK
ncbi:alpha/beta hydrolase [Sorangium sp. So ce341]|uniref:alpha/beta hydrolase n=1 Tax=Sorangium sp. So ce341 TaxID=3133302 RepID=UPI003F62E440